MRDPSIFGFRPGEKRAWSPSGELNKEGRQEAKRVTLNVPTDFLPYAGEVQHSLSHLQKNRMVASNMMGGTRE